MSAGNFSGTLKTTITKLEAAFRYTYSEGQLSILHKAISGFKPKHVQRAGDNLIATCKFAPVVKDIIDAVRSAWGQDEEERKKQYEEQAQEFYHGERPALTAHVTDAQLLIRDINDRKVTGAPILERMRAIGHKYPKFSDDWRRCANELEARFERRDRGRNAQERMERAQRDLPAGPASLPGIERAEPECNQAAAGSEDQYVPPW